MVRYGESLCSSLEHDKFSAPSGEVAVTAAVWRKLAIKMTKFTDCTVFNARGQTGTWAFYTPRQAKALEILAAPAAASGDWGTGRGRDDLQRLTILSLLRN